MYLFKVGTFLLQPLIFLIISSHPPLIYELMLFLHSYPQPLPAAVSPQLPLYQSPQRPPSALCPPPALHSREAPLPHHTPLCPRPQDVTWHPPCMEVYLLRPGQQEVSVAIVTVGPPIRDTPLSIRDTIQKALCIKDRIFLPNNIICTSDAIQFRTKCCVWSCPLLRGFIVYACMVRGHQATCCSFPWHVILSTSYHLCLHTW